MEKLLQQELARMYSSDFGGVSRMELTPFVAVLKVIKLEYSEHKPEVYRLLVALLKDYNPHIGHTHWHKTVTYLRILLVSHPDLAEFLISILPHYPDGSHSNTSIVNLMKRSSESQINATVTKRMKPDRKCYNYSAPGVSAYVATQGVPQRVTSSGTSLAATIATAIPVVSVPKHTADVSCTIGAQVMPQHASDISRTMAAQVLPQPPRATTWGSVNPGSYSVDTHTENTATTNATTRTISLNELKTMVASRDGLDLRSLSVLHRERDNLFNGKTIPGIPQKITKTEELKNKQKTLMLATSEAKARVDVMDREAIVKALRNMAGTDKYLKVKIRNPKSKSSGPFTKLTPTITESKKSLSQPQIVTIAGSDLKVKKSASTTDIPEKASGNVMYEVQGSSYIFPYHQQITLANGSYDQGEKQNYIINRPAQFTNPAPMKVWNPPQYYPNTASAVMQSYSQAQPLYPVDLRASDLRSSAPILSSTLPVPTLSSPAPTLSSPAPTLSSPGLSELSMVDVENSIHSSSPDAVSYLSEEPLTDSKPSTPGILKLPDFTASCMTEGPTSDNGDGTSEDEHMLLLSQMDGTSDRGDFSLPGSSLQSPIISPLTIDVGKATTTNWSEQTGVRCEAGIPHYSPLTQDTVERMNYLSRLITTPSPPNCTNPWGVPAEVKPEVKRSKPKPPVRRRRKIRR